MTATRPGDDARSLEERLRDPDAWHRPAAYWFWHHLPEPEQIRRQVGELANAGIRTFQIQARLAYPIEGYLDEDYLAACRIAVEEAARLGLMVGVYDDYNWQTGHAAGRAVEGHDELRERQLFWTSGTLEGGRVQLAVDDIHSSSENLGPAGMSWHYEGGVSQWGDWELAFAFAGRGADAIDVTNAARLTEYRTDGCRIELALEAPDGTPVTVFVAARNTTSRLVNFLDRRAAERFVEAGYEPFHDALGEFFGSTITYFFFDQPHANFYTWAQHHGDLGTAMPYRSELPRLIRERWRGRHAHVMLALLEGDDAESRALRAQFYEFFSREAIDVFLGTLHDWTSHRGVLLSGHEVLGHVGSWNLDDAFGDWDLRVNFGLDYFRVDSYRDLTGVDAQDTSPQLSAKLGDSVARANGRSGTIVEQYFAQAHAGSGSYAGHWGLTLEELRAQSIRHHLLGMRQLLFHGFYQTDGFDDDPRMFVNPRFDFPPGENFEPWFAEHHADFAIETARLSEFLEGAEPACDVALLYPLRAAWTDGQHGPHAREVGAWAEALATLGYGYHLVDEEALVAAPVRDGRVWFGERGYASIVLPGATTLRSSATTDALRRFLEAGIVVVASGATPRGYQEGEQTAEVDVRELVAAGARRISSAAEAGVIESLALPRTPDAARVAVRGAAWRWVGRVGDEVRIAVFNDSDESVEVGIAASPGAPLARVDAASGALVALEANRLELEPMGLAMIVVGRSGTPHGPQPRAALREVHSSGGWSLELDGHEGAVPIDPSRGWELQGFPAYSGIGRYRATLELEADGELEIELPAVAGSVVARLDGVELGRRGWRPYVFRTRASSGPHELELAVASSAANRYYAGTGFRDAPEPAGLLAEPRLHTTQDDGED